MVLRPSLHGDHNQSKHTAHQTTAKSHREAVRIPKHKYTQPCGSSCRYNVIFSLGLFYRIPVWSRYYLPASDLSYSTKLSVYICAVRILVSTHTISVHYTKPSMVSEQLGSSIAHPYSLPCTYLREPDSHLI